jgi:uncharacterized small protein (DUF1192 family)
MATTPKDGASTKDPVAKLTDLGEGAIKRFSDAPGADRLLGALNTTRDRLDELQRRLRGIDELEKRVAVLERKVDKLSKGASPRAAKSSTKTAAKSSS